LGFALQSKPEGVGGVDDPHEGSLGFALQSGVDVDGGANGVD